MLPVGLGIMLMVEYVTCVGLNRSGSMETHGTSHQRSSRDSEVVLKFLRDTLDYQSKRPYNRSMKTNTTPNFHVQVREPRAIHTQGSTTFTRETETIFSLKTDEVEIRGANEVSTNSYTQFGVRSHTVRPDRKARVFVSVDSEFNLMEDLENRTRRPYKAYREGVLKALNAIGIEPTKISWSQFAGCSMCPCSPGFIVEGAPETNTWNFWVTLRGAPKVDESKPARILVEAF